MDEEIQQEGARPFRLPGMRSATSTPKRERARTVPHTPAHLAPDSFLSPQQQHQQQQQKIRFTVWTNTHHELAALNCAHRPPALRRRGRRPVPCSPPSNRAAWAATLGASMRASTSRMCHTSTGADPTQHYALWRCRHCTRPSRCEACGNARCTRPAPAIGGRCVSIECSHMLMSHTNVVSLCLDRSRIGLERRADISDVRGADFCLASVSWRMRKWRSPGPALTTATNPRYTAPALYRYNGVSIFHPSHSALPGPCCEQVQLLARRPPDESCSKVRCCQHVWYKRITHMQGRDGSRRGVAAGAHAIRSSTGAVPWSRFRVCANKLARNENCQHFF